MAGTRFDGLDLEVLRSRKSEKWHTYPPDVLPAWVAEMDFPIASPIEAVLREALDRNVFHLTPRCQVLTPRFDQNPTFEQVFKFEKLYVFRNFDIFRNENNKNI